MLLCGISSPDLRSEAFAQVQANFLPTSPGPQSKFIKQCARLATSHQVLVAKWTEWMLNFNCLYWEW